MPDLKCSFFVGSHNKFDQSLLRIEKGLYGLCARPRTEGSHLCKDHDDMIKNLDPTKCSSCQYQKKPKPGKRLPNGTLCADCTGESEADQRLIIQRFDAQ